MKKNLPATQREIDYPESKVLVTKTDTKGVITYTNDSFAEISGFSREELIGNSHNIARHPDMPEWVFKNLWDTVKGGHPWRGIVKNRAKNGDHYWARATVSPITNHGTVVGYISLRKKPTRAEISVAEMLYKSGGAASSRLPLIKRFKNLALQKKLQLMIQPALLILLGIANYAIYNHINSSVLTSTQQRALGIANEVIDTANMLMVTGQIGDVNTRQLLVKKISSSGNITELHLIRAQQVVKVFGPGLPEEHVRDEIEQRVIDSNKPYYAMEQHEGKPVFRAVTPYVASRDFHGTDCTTCHQAEGGTVLGASDVEIDLSTEIASLRTVVSMLIIGQLVLQLFLFLFIKWVIRIFVSEPVDEIKENLSEVVNGHMTSQVDISGRDEMGEVLCSVQSTKVLLASIIDQIASVSGNIDERAKHLSDAMTKVAESSQTQSGAASSMAAAVKEMTASIDQIAENTGTVRSISDNSAILASEGGKIVQNVVNDMAKTNQAVVNTSQTMKKLGEQSDRIQNVVKVIKEISDQTNLLALNAAIEAARAGEQGRGFAVVADEVRKLAEKTGNSTLEIAGMVDEIRNSTNHAIGEMEATVEMVKAGSVMAEKAGRSIVEINDGVSRALSGVEDISSSIREQSVASREIAVNVEKVSNMTDKNSEAVKEVFGTVGNLESLASALEQSIRHFHI